MGSETPASAMPIAARSKTLPRRSAESTPMATPPTSQMTGRPTASDSVTGSRSSRSGQTGLLRDERVAEARRRAVLDAGPVS